MYKQDLIIIEDNNEHRQALDNYFKSKNINAKSFADGNSAIAFLESIDWDAGCVITDVMLPDIDGISIAKKIKKADPSLPIIIITGYATVSMAVKAIKNGAKEFFTKPLNMKNIYMAVMQAMAITKLDREQRQTTKQMVHLIEGLTAREKEIMKLLSYGLSNKEVAQYLNISPRTVEVHRSHIIEKLNAKSVTDIVRVSLVANL